MKIFAFLFALSMWHSIAIADTKPYQLYDSNGNVVTSTTVEVPPPDPKEVAQASDKEEFKTSTFRNMTPAEADQWIQTNVTDLASAKVALRKMSRVLMYLVRRSDL